jgi:hypothetical protein
MPGPTSSPPCLLHSLSHHLSLSPPTPSDLLFRVSLAVAWPRRPRPGARAEIDLPAGLSPTCQAISGHSAAHPAARQALRPATRPGGDPALQLLSLTESGWQGTAGSDHRKTVFIIHDNEQ